MPLELETLKAYLATTQIGRAPGWENEVWDSIDSTNNRAAELASQGAPHGVIVMARHQTAGRGRLGRTWISPPDAGVFVSFLFRPNRKHSELPLYTLAAGVACSRAIQECVGIEIGLKWVNDLTFQGKKVGGILTEIPSLSLSSPAASNTTLLPATALVVGIGINIHFEEHEIPDHIKERMDWLERITQQPVDPNLLVAYLATHLEQIYDQLAKGQSSQSGQTAQSSQIIDAWKKHSVTLGKFIHASSGNTTIEGLAVDISETGGLIVESNTGERTTLHAGEITIRNIDGSYT